jgi:hypothetical protein
VRSERQLKKVALLLLLNIFIASLSPSHANEIEPCGWIDRTDPDRNKNQPYGHEVSGESYRAANSFSLLKQKSKKILSESGEHVGFLLYTDAKLVPEPKNKFDKFAVKVMIKNKHVGYVPKSFSFETARYMNKNKIKNLEVEACIIYTVERADIQYNNGPQVYLHFQEELFPEIYWWYGNSAIINRNEKGPGAKCTSYFSKWFCGLDG